MSQVHSPSIEERGTASAEPALRILNRLLRGVRRPPGLRLWNQVEHTCVPDPDYILVVRTPALLRRLVLGGSPLALADGYFRGHLDVEGDLYAALSLKSELQHLSLSWRDKLMLFADALRLPSASRAARKPNERLTSRAARCFAHRHTRASDRDAIIFHYDVSNEFYGLWLDRERVYSCGYFLTEHDSIDTAQRNKLEHICRKLRLRPGESFLDIGCGWGALVCWAARHHGVKAHGITLSERQLQYAKARIRAEGLEDRVTVELRDYRDLPQAARFDKVASIGMFEHVGLANLPAYYAVVLRVLRPGGLFLNHGITHDEEGWSRTIATEFINRYVFPDGELDCISNIQLGMERAGLEIHDVEGLRPHYALTLRHWVRRLEGNRAAAVGEVGESAYRIWRLYMAACAIEFEQGGTSIYQILASHRDHGRWPVPLTRSDVYR
jgi:cyclopropane-fatty-acyl-phospholipid synthase